MNRSHPTGTRSRMVPIFLTILAVLSTLLCTSACGSDTSPEQQLARRSQVQLEKALQHASQIGVPASLLLPIQEKEQALARSRAPFALFDQRPVQDYFHSLVHGFNQLSQQLIDAIKNGTDKLRSHAQQDVQTLQTTLQVVNEKQLPSGLFASAVNQAQQQLDQAQQPRNYTQVSKKAQQTVQSLNQLIRISQTLNTFEQQINLLQASHLEITSIQSLYQKDKQAFANIQSIAEMQHVGQVITAHSQQALLLMQQAIPALSNYKIGELKQWIGQVQQQHDEINIYEEHLSRYQKLLKPQMNVADYQRFAGYVDGDITQLQMTWYHNETTRILQQFHQEAASWGNAHVYHSDYDGQNYLLNNGYLDAGVGSDLDAQLASARTAEEFKAAYTDARNTLFNLQMMEQDYNDHTPYNEVHATDTQLLDHYQLKQGQVIVVSLVEQAMHLYQDGRLVRSFLVTTGRPEKPSLPGLWSFESRLSPTIFRSSEPHDSPYWYPDTPIHYAMLYHAGGYYIHDSWWRDSYGPGTQFPHADASGNQSFAGNGSHGCINMQENEASWLYANTGWDTRLIVY